MKILLLSDANSSHTIKWVTSLAIRDIDILIFSLNNKHEYNKYKNIKIKSLNEKVTKKEGSIFKLKYLKALPLLKKIIKEYNPDILHAHYASSYGLLVL